MIKKLLGLFHIQQIGMIPQPGTVAPAFSVEDHNGKTVKLSALKGKRVVLWFYPKADTPG